MGADDSKPQTVEAYISQFPEPVRDKLKTIRALIHETVPEALGTISYGMPTFKLKGVNLIHFAAFKHHIGLYPMPSGIEQFSAELKLYKHARGSVQFPLDQPVPFDLIKRVALFRVDEESRKKAQV